jgi:uncharacterized protein (TIGR02594 family)
MPTIVPSLVSPARGRAILLATGCLVFLTIEQPALARPAPGDARPSQSEITRAAQLRHARAVQTSARKTVRLPAGALSAHASVGSKRPPFGWPTLVTEARKYIGTNPTKLNKRWCARFLNLVLNKTGYSGTNSDAARSFASYGRRISEPRVGAIAVLARGKNRNLGHVGIVTGVDANGNPIIISGNHGHRVGEATYPRARVIAYVMPVSGGGTQMAQAGNVPLRTSDAGHDGGLTSPIAELLAAINAERGEPRQPVRPAPLAVQPPQRPTMVTTRVPDRTVGRSGRIIQQLPSEEPQARQRVATAYHVTVVSPTPLPRPRTALSSAPVPRSRPLAN